MRKEKKKEEKKLQREFNKIVVGLGAEERMDLELARREQMQRQKEELLVGTTFEPRTISSYRSKRNLPYVFDAYESTPLCDFELGGIKMALPEGTQRKVNSRCQQVTVPAQERSTNLNVHPIMVDSLDPVS